MADVKDLVKPPFANYDVVVYFGCGLFSLPLIHHYVIEPLGLRFPRLEFRIGSDFASSAVSTLTLLFGVYILGHMIAYAASWGIEKSVDTVFGKISSAVIISTLSERGQRFEMIRAWMFYKARRSWKAQSKFWIFIRALLIIPVTPALVFSFGLGTFDYFRTRIPPNVFRQIKRLAARRGYGRIGLHTPWYKAIEHDVINNNSAATARMYNYLVIAGIFRSLSLIFVLCAWAEVYYTLHAKFDGHHLVKTIMSDRQLPLAHLITICAYNFTFMFCVSAYIKFSRRYVEEALFAFVLCRKDRETDPNTD